MPSVASPTEIVKSPKIMSESKAVGRPVRISKGEDIVSDEESAGRDTMVWGLFDVGKAVRRLDDFLVSLGGSWLALYQWSPY
jgi:hypothetical protein